MLTVSLIYTYKFSALFLCLYDIMYLHYVNLWKENTKIMNFRDQGINLKNVLKKFGLKII